MPAAAVEYDVQRDHRDQHQQAAEQAVEQELHRRVLPLADAEAPDHEVHRDQHGLEEDVEQEDVGGREDADHHRLEHQHQREVGLHAAPRRAASPGRSRRPSASFQRRRGSRPASARRSSGSAPARCRRRRPRSARRTAGSTGRSAVNWKRRAAGLELRPPSTIVTPSVTSEKTSASRLTSRSRARRSAWPPGADRPGVSAITIAPTSGIAPATVSQGKSTHRFCSLTSQQQQRADQQHRADEHRQRIGTDEAGLQPAQPPRRAAERGGDGVDQPVHAAVVEVHRAAGSATGPAASAPTR